MALTNTEPFQLWPGKKVFCLITGASKGIGKSFAVEIAKYLKNNVVFALIARSKDLLNSTKDIVSEFTPAKQVFTASMDFSMPESGAIYNFISQKLEELSVSPNYFDHVLIICCAGSLGNLEHSALSMDDAQEWQKYLSLNVSSCAIQVHDFMKVFNDCQVKRFVVNITSLFAITVQESLGYYCIGKAAREMYFKVLAKENPEFRVLNYSPGPVSTDMVDEILENVRSEKVRNSFLAIKSEGNLLTPTMTTTVALRVLEEDSYESGEHVDYFEFVDY